VSADTCFDCRKYEVLIDELKRELVNMDEKRGFQLTKRLKAEAELAALKAALDEAMEQHTYPPWLADIRKAVTR
jgi:hypothetical protein